jgi:hypothetical protein
MVELVQEGMPHLSNTLVKEAKHSMLLLEPGLSSLGLCYSDAHPGRLLDPSAVSDLFSCWRALNSQEFTLLEADSSPKGWESSQPWRLEGHDYYTFNLRAQYPEACALPRNMRTVGQIVDAGHPPITFNLEGAPCVSMEVYDSNTKQEATGVVCVGPDKLVYFVVAGEPQPKWVEPTRPSLADKIFSSNVPVVDNRIYSSRLNKMIPLTKHTGGGPTAAHCFGGQYVTVDHPQTSLRKYTNQLSNRAAKAWCKRLQETLNI